MYNFCAHAVTHDNLPIHLRDRSPYKMGYDVIAPRAKKYKVLSAGGFRDILFNLNASGAGAEIVKLLAVPVRPSEKW